MAAADDGPGTARLISFTDAVVAIAITLLVLPPVDEFASPPDPRAGHSGQLALVHAFGGHASQLIAFGLSFALIARLWWWHHRVFELLTSLTVGMVLLDLAWMFTIVALPLPTVIIAAWDRSPLSFATYAGTLLASAVFLTAMTIARFRDAGEAQRSGLRRGMASSVVTTVAFAIALVVGLLAAPGWGYACYFLTVLAGPVDAVVTRRAARRAVRAAP